MTGLLRAVACLAFGHRLVEADTDGPHVQLHCLSCGRDQWHIRPTTRTVIDWKAHQ